MIVIKIENTARESSQNQTYHTSNRSYEMEKSDSCSNPAPNHERSLQGNKDYVFIVFTKVKRKRQKQKQDLNFLVFVEQDTCVLFLISFMFQVNCTLLFPCAFDFCIVLFLQISKCGTALITSRLPCNVLFSVLWGVEQGRFLWLHEASHHVSSSARVGFLNPRASAFTFY